MSAKNKAIISRKHIRNRHKNEFQRMFKVFLGVCRILRDAEIRDIICKGHRHTQQ